MVDVEGVTTGVKVVRSGVVDGDGTTGLEDVKGVTIDVERWSWHDVVVNGVVYDSLGLGLGVRLSVSDS